MGNPPLTPLFERGSRGWGPKVKCLKAEENRKKMTEKNKKTEKKLQESGTN